MKPAHVLYIRPQNRPHIFKRVLEIAQKLASDKAWEVIFREHDPQRSLEQNARLWKLHTLASEATGYTPEEMHEIALKACFGTKVVELAGVTLEVPLQRSSTLGKKRFAKFMTFVEDWYIRELGVYLPAQEVDGYESERRAA